MNYKYYAFPTPSNEKLNCTEAEERGTFREKLFMIHLTCICYEISYDDCIL